MQPRKQFGSEFNELFLTELQPFQKELGNELADMLAYVLKLANYAGIDLESAYLEKMQYNLKRQWSS